MKMLGYLWDKLNIKVSPLVWHGMGFDHVGTTRVRTEDGMWMQVFPKYTENALRIMGMENCNASTSPKLDKQFIEGDAEDYDKPENYRSATCTLLYSSKRTPETQSTLRWLCKRLLKPNVQSGRQLVNRFIVLFSRQNYCKKVSYRYNPRTLL